MITSCLAWLIDSRSQCLMDSSSALPTEIKVNSQFRIYFVVVDTNFSYHFWFLEIYQDPAKIEAFKSVIENCSEIEQDMEHELALIGNFHCESVEDFDKEFVKLLKDSQNGRPSAKESNRYQTFIKDLEDVQYANEQTQAEPTQADQSVTVDGMTVQCGEVRIDPISKAPIKNPYKNKNCGHTYDYDSIVGAIRMNSRTR